MSDLLPEEAEVLELLGRLGLAVTPVPRGREKSPDFLVDGDGRGYVIEVKTRCDSEQWQRSLREGSVAYEARATGYGRWTEDVIRSALKQLPSADPHHKRWWVLWFFIACRAASDAMFNQAIGSLFGVRQVVDLGSDAREKPVWNCLFARPGVFEKHQEIVAAVVSRSRRITLCVNESAPDYGAFIQSSLYREFADIHFPISATDLVQHCGFLQVNASGIERRDEAAVARYLAETYSLVHPIILDMESHSASIVADR